MQGIIPLQQKALPATFTDSHFKRFKIIRTTGFIYIHYYSKCAMVNVNDKDGMLSGKIVDTDSNYGFYDC
jgi:hypothetical protein